MKAFNDTRNTPGLVPTSMEKQRSYIHACIQVLRGKTAVLHTWLHACIQPLLTPWPVPCHAAGLPLHFGPPGGQTTAAVPAWFLPRRLVLDGRRLTVTDFPLPLCHSLVGCCCGATCRLALTPGGGGQCCSGNPTGLTLTSLTLCAFFGASTSKGSL